MKPLIRMLRSQGCARRNRKARSRWFVPRPELLEQRLAPSGLPPYAVADIARTMSGIMVTIPVLANDSDPDGDHLTLQSIVTPPTNGTAMISGDRISYTPTPGSFGVDSFVYLVDDDDGNSATSATALVQVRVSVEDVGSQFIENFSDDFNLALPGFDSWDLNPFTVPGGDTDDDPNTSLGPDIFPIPHDTGPRIRLERNRFGNTTPFLLIGGSLVPDSYDIDFYSVPFEDGGLPPSAEVVTVGFRYRGMGRIVVEGDNGVKTLNVPDSGAWSGLAVVSNDPSDTGGEVGAIQRVHFTPLEDQLLIDDLSILIFEAGFSNNPPGALPDSATTLPGQPVEIDFLANDGDADGDPISFAGVTGPPLGGSVAIVSHPISNRLIAIYAPRSGTHGIDSFAYEIADTRGATATGTVTITVNTPPPAHVVRIPVPHDHRGPFTFSRAALLAGAADADGDTLTIASIGAPLFGALTENADGSLTFVPSTPDGLVPDDNQIPFRLSDGFAVGDFGVALLDPNDTPRAIGQVIDIAHGVSGPLQRLLRFEDDDGDPVAFSLVNLPIDASTGFARTAHGQLRLNHDPSGAVEFEYRPDSGEFRVSDQFRFRVTDMPYGTSATATVEIRVPNDAPIADHDFYDVAPTAGDVTLRVLQNDYDPDGDPLLAISLVDAPLYGTAIINSDRTISYAPGGLPLVSPGLDMFSYRTTDGDRDSNLAWVTVRVTNGEVFAVSDHYPTHRDFNFCLSASASTGVLSNDFSPAGRPLRVTSWIPVASGPVSFTPLSIITDNGELFPDDDGSFCFIPAEDFEGIEQYRYRVTDNVTTDLGTVLFVVSDHFLHALHDHYSVDANSVLSVAAPGLFANDDPVGQGGIENLSLPSFGVLEIGFGDGSFTYRPMPGFTGIDRFSYNLSDGQGGISGPAIVTIEVVGDPPVAVGETFRVPSGGQSGLDVLANETHSGPLSAVRLTGPSADTGPGLALVGLHKSDGFVNSITRGLGERRIPFTGIFDYTSPPEFAGLDSFTYMVSDGSLVSQPVTAVIQVNAPPIAVDDEVELSFNSGGFRGGLLDNDSDPDGDFFQARLVRPPSHIILEGFDSDGGFNYRTGDFHGEDSFTYEVFDDLDVSRGTATVTIAINHSPVASNDGFEFHPQAGNLVVAAPGVLADDTDQDFDSLTAALVSDPIGTVHFNSDGSFTYTPLPGFVGEDTFTYEATDGRGLSNIATVSILVANARPVANNNLFRLHPSFSGQGPPYELSVAMNDTDADGDLLRVEIVIPSRFSFPFLVNATGTLVIYNINPALVGIDSFTYRVSDGWSDSEPATVMIIAADPLDSDFDGVQGSVEADRPNSGDGNGDGISDHSQRNVASLPAFGANDIYLTLAAPTGTQLAQVRAMAAPSQTPAGFDFDFNFVDFQAFVGDSGDSTTVSVYLSPATIVDTYFKHGPLPQDDPATPQNETVPHWYEFLFDGSTGAEFFDAAGQPVLPHSGAQVERIDLHLVDGGRGDQDRVANGIVVDPGGPAARTRPPQIQSVVINDGHAQRSKIDSITVRFDRPVTIDPGAFELWQQGANKPLKLDLALSEQDGHTLARLTFKSHHVVGGSLPDGDYRLVIRGDKIHDAAGRLLDGDGDGQSGGDRVDEFFRRFGDTDGDDDVDCLDADTFGSTFGKRSNQSGYLWYLDYNANGRIWAEDLALFLLGYVRSALRR